MAGKEDYLSAIANLPALATERIINNKAILTDCHCHWALLTSGFYSIFLEGVGSCNYIGGQDIRNALALSFNIPNTIWHQIPAEAKYNELQDRPHYPDYYCMATKDLDRPLDGQLFLVAAGLLGKIYCGIIKSRGGIAIDIGAVADFWANRLDTRGYVRKNQAILTKKKHI